MVAYVVLGNFTDQGIRNAKESPKRAEAFKAMALTRGVDGPLSGFSVQDLRHSL